MHYFFLENQSLGSGLAVSLKNGDISHAHRVLRIKKNEVVAISDGFGNVHKGIVVTSSPKEVTIELGEKLLPAESPLKITIAQGLVKGDKFDLIVRQAVELGVVRIQPLLTERSVPHRSRQQEEKRLQRWRSIARSAAAQCRRAFLPAVEDVIKLKEYLHQAEMETIITPWEGERAVPLSSLLKQPSPEKGTVTIIIGPEGGLTEREIELLNKTGAITVHLGLRILRSETASSTVIALVQSAWGDL
ncbi:MAG: 16S rRNA (uracil(1498)-N(3))-methyltransferase [Dethiobacteria bacterium]